MYIYILINPCISTMQQFIFSSSFWITYFCCCYYAHQYVSWIFLSFFCLGQLCLFYPNPGNCCEPNAYIYTLCVCILFLFQGSYAFIFNSHIGFYFQKTLLLKHAQCAPVHHAHPFPKCSLISVKVITHHIIFKLSINFGVITYTPPF